jgi:hypothetical protein
MTDPTNSTTPSEYTVHELAALLQMYLDDADGAEHTSGRAARTAAIAAIATTAATLDLPDLAAHRIAHALTRSQYAGPHLAADLTTQAARLDLLELYVDDSDRPDDDTTPLGMVAAAMAAFTANPGLPELACRDLLVLTLATTAPHLPRPNRALRRIGRALAAAGTITPADADHLSTDDGRTHLLDDLGCPLF